MPNTKTEQSDLKSCLREILDIEAEHWALGRLFSPPGNAAVPVWGLFVTDKGDNLHFVSFDQDNWLSALTKAGSPLNRKSSNGIKHHLTFPVSRRESLEQITKRGFFSFLQKPFPLYHLKQNGEKETVIFELEDPESPFLNALIRGSHD
ncbi:MAG: hypothetical protein PQJ58_04430 [Spirochaetales bacterium]|nr:hypothetical protein [Spirochaetales bacterium]